MSLICRRTFLPALLICFALLSLLSLDGYQRSTFDSPSQVSAQGEEPLADPSHPSPQILLVSALFPLSKSKHSMNEYSFWLYHFLDRITTDIYFFTTPDMEPFIRKLRRDLPITINTTFSTPLEIPPLLGYKHRYSQMHTQDREKHIHSSELYAVWNGKAYFLDEAVKNTEKMYDYAFWNDAGSFRDAHTYVAWPDGRRVDKIWEEGSRASGEKKEDLLFFPMYRAPHASFRHWQESMGPVDTEFSEGSFFGGTPKTISWWRHVFYSYHNHYLSQGVFVGKDQTLINALFLLFPSRIITVWLGDPQVSHAAAVFSSLRGGVRLRSCPAGWFYYQYFFARAEERAGMRRLWDAKAEERGMWSWSWWLRHWQGCKLAGVLGMEGVLKRTFGKQWRSPGKSVELVTRFIGN